MSKFTPGPWNAKVTSADQALIISEATGANVAVVYDKRDAPIFEAAPDMYAALESLLDMITDNRTHGPEIDSACAALAKARGES